MLQRKRLGAAYDAALSGHVGVVATFAGAENAYGLYTIRLPDAVTRPCVGGPERAEDR